MYISYIETVLLQIVIVVKMANLFHQCYLPHVLYYYDLAVSRSLAL